MAFPGTVQTGSLRKSRPVELDSFFRPISPWLFLFSQSRGFSFGLYQNRRKTYFKGGVVTQVISPTRMAPFKK